MRLGLWFLASYLLGAIPTSYLVVRLVKGEDLRRLGSGNLGATNLFRQLGWKYAVPWGCSICSREPFLWPSSALAPTVES